MIKPPAAKDPRVVKRRQTNFSRRHLEESDPVPLPVKKKVLVPPYALHSEPTISRKKAVAKPVPKEDTFISGKKALRKHAWNVSTFELV